ncbi:type 4a pilus biogenesis protein PilO [Deinococcus peraridilitoris]|uniref:Tfp pilus assembly protein PilO n=1 Tax=Deinococcus peraridilitoris (strain DSM 19664 / LMG 22246 / CIP 109416 / KR-200) TaxID=937777 RepID=L0A5S9_DEIPD|nr:type 4a pilus biogenesis protein PilO [Deinococcus peraridilitoris]AFZ69238.1 Tfp pilus assembly protein PilO [Deinococcus peraridilitoris DSM 19664]
MGSFSLSKLKGRDVFLIVVVLVVLASALWYTLFYSASKAEIDNKKLELESLATQVQASRAAVAQLPALQQDVAQLSLQRDELLRALPATAKMGSLLSEIRTNVLASGAELTGVTQGGGQAAGLPAGVRPLGISLSLDGQFAPLYRVLKSLEAMNRFSTINSVGLTMGNPESFDPKLSGQVALTIYTFDPSAAGQAGNNAPNAAPAAPSAPPAGGNQ